MPLPPPFLAALLSLAATCSYQVVRPAQGDADAAFLAWLSVHSAVLGDAAHLLEPGAAPLEVRIVDVDNDGADEYVLAASEGSGHFLSMWVFRKAGREWKLVTPTPFDARFPGAREYRGPHMDESHLLARFCGRTYVSFMGGRVPNYFPEAYVWEKDEAHPACDTPWLQHQRRAFQALFERKRYDEAHVLLDGVQAACAGKADPDTWLWMQSDLALAAQRMRSYATCLAHTAAAETSTAFAAAGAVLRQAIAANARRCRAAQKSGFVGDPSYDFSWLSKVPPRTQIVMDSRFDGLLSAIVPEASGADGQPLRDALKLSVWLAEAPSLVAGRYLLVAGCEPHDCGNRGFIWIDRVEHKAIMAAGATLASTTIDAAHVPEAFWKQAPLAAGIPLEYVGPDGKRMAIEAPSKGD